MTIEFSSVICVVLTLPIVSPNLHPVHSFVANLHAFSLATLHFALPSLQHASSSLLYNDVQTCSSC